MAAYSLMGRHTSAETAGPGARVAVLAIVGALVAAALIWFGVSRGLGGEDTASDGEDPVTNSDDAAASAFADAMGDAHSEHTEEAEDSAATTEAAAEEATATEEPAAASEEPEEGLPEAVASCVTQVAAGEKVAEAAAISADHWKTHYSQTIMINAGEIEPEDATEPWAETKAAGPDDQKRFTAAQESYADAEGGCDGVTAEDAGDAVDAGDVEDCVTRSEALATVAERGEKVNADWDAHLEQMAVKEDYPADEYYQWWLDVVEKAPDNMDPYEDAVAALEDAPACSLTT